MSKEERPKVKKVEFKVDPYQGAARMVVSMQLPGYALRKMDRKGTKVVVTYDRIDEDSSP